MQSILPLEVQAEMHMAVDGLPDNKETARKALDDLISALWLTAQVLN